MICIRTRTQGYTLAGIRRVKGVRRLGVRLGNWLSAEQAKRLLSSPAPESLRGKHDRAMLAVLLRCGLRRGELLALTMEDVQLREEHWVIADLDGKAGHVRTSIAKVASAIAISRSITFRCKSMGLRPTQLSTGIVVFPHAHFLAVHVSSHVVQLSIFTVPLP